MDGYASRKETAAMPDAETRFRSLYPFASHRHDLGGMNYHYLDEGEGPPVVMVHGNPTWSFFFRGLVLGLRDKRRCLVPDHLGMGFSDKPQQYAYTLENHAANLERWLDAVLPPAGDPGGKVTLVLHDWGGPIGLAYWLRRPERVARLVLMNTSAFGEDRLPKRIALVRIPGLGALLVRGANAFARCATRMTTVKPMPRDVREGYLRPYDSWAHRIGTLRFVQDVPRTPTTPSKPLFDAIERALPRLRDWPVLLQWGEKDWCFTTWFRDEWLRRLPGTPCDNFPDAGHYLLEDEPAAVTRNIRAFLAQHDGAGE